MTTVDALKVVIAGFFLWLLYLLLPLIIPILMGLLSLMVAAIIASVLGVMVLWYRFQKSRGCSN